MAGQNCNNAIYYCKNTDIFYYNLVTFNYLIFFIIMNNFAKIE